MPRTDLTARYGTDPVPWVTDIWAEALDTRSADERAARALTALDAVIGGLADDERPYAVRYAGEPVGAATDLKGRTVHVGAAPLSDATLSRGQIAAIMSGLAFHEACHIRYTRHVMGAYAAFAGDSARAHRVGNIAEDIRGERLGCEAFPGLAATLPVTLAWVAGRTMPRGGLKATRIGDRLNVLLSATRYAEWVDWTGAEAERTRWLEWAERAAVAHTVAAHTAVIREALDLLDSPPLTDPDQGEDKGDEGDEGEPGGDEGTGEGKGKGAGKGDDEQGEGTGDGGEPGEGDEPGEGTGEGDEQGEGKTPTPSTTQGAEGKGGSDGRKDDDGITLPSCPAESVHSALDARAQAAAEAVARARREVGGVRRYPGGTVIRAYPTTRGRAIARPEGERTAFVSPTTGRGLTPQTPEQTSTVRPTERPLVSRALAGAIASARRGDPAPEPGQRSGTLDRTRLGRVASGDCRVFVNRVSPGPSRIRAIVLLDASGSMGVALDAEAARKAVRSGADWRTATQTRSTAAAQIGVDMAGAFALMPNVKGAVYAHNVNIGGDSTVHALWQSGEPIAYAADYAGLHLDGNRDDVAIRYCTDDLLDARRPGEALVLIVVSDGAPPNKDLVRDAVKDARDRGVAVVSVAIATEAEDGQRHMYGNDVVLFTPEPLILARSIARAIGKVI